MTTYTYTSLNPPGSLNTVPSGINNSGEVVGTYNTGSAGTAHGFTEINGTFTTIDYSGAIDTIAAGENNSGEVVGSYIDSEYNYHGFSVSNGVFASFDYPGSIYMQPSAVNDSGEIVGAYDDAGGNLHGFVYSGGTFSSVDYPLAGASYTSINGVNNAGELVGQYDDANDVTHGFTDIGGTFATIDVPASISTTVTSTVVSGVNSAGDLVGTYDDASGSHGFTDVGGVFSTLDDPDPTAGNGTFARGLNDSGEVVGSGAKTNGSSVGFLATPAPCYVTGTLIRTARGDVAVEALSVGDIVVTASGAERPITWIGHRTVICRNSLRPWDLLPICISAHAIGENRPARDLFVSPGHSICIDVLGEVLIPAIALVNGATIQQVEVDEVTYWHVELDSHDVILAENLPAESYLDMGNRGFFKEADVVDLVASPDGDPATRTHADFCRPFHGGGPLVDVVKAQLARRAEARGWMLTRDLDMHLDVDGRRLEPVVRGLTARFALPAGAKDVWLVSPTARPSDTMGSGDTRDLGLCIGALRVDDGFEPRDIAIDNPLLCEGFYEAQEDGRRWTANRARLPAALWDGYEDGFYLRVELAGLPVPRWTAPVAEPVATDRLRLAIVA